MRYKWEKGLAAFVIFLLLAEALFFAVSKPETGYIDRLLAGCGTDIKTETGAGREETGGDIQTARFLVNTELARSISETAETIEDGEWADHFTVEGGFLPPFGERSGNEAEEAGGILNFQPAGSQGTELHIVYQTQNKEKELTDGTEGLCGHLRQSADTGNAYWDREPGKVYTFIWEDISKDRQGLVCPECGAVAENLSYSRYHLSQLEFVDALEAVGFTGLREFMECVEEYNAGDYRRNFGDGYAFSILMNRAVVVYGKEEFRISYRYTDYYVEEGFAGTAVKKVGEGWGIGFSSSGGIVDQLVLQTRDTRNVSGYMDFSNQYSYTAPGSTRTAEQEKAWGRWRDTAVKYSLYGIPVKMMFLYYQEGRLTGLRIHASYQYMDLSEKYPFFGEREQTTASAFLEELGIAKGEAEAFVSGFSGREGEEDGKLGGMRWEYRMEENDSAWLTFLPETAD